MKIKIKDFETEITHDELKKDVFDVDFGGVLKIQITKKSQSFKITNAMNGYGQNCKKEFENEKIIFISNNVTCDHVWHYSEIDRYEYCTRCGVAKN